LGSRPGGTRSGHPVEMVRRDLLREIERGAHNPRSALAPLLRRCITLGGVTGSESLREWATSELMGYSDGDELPDYRRAAAPLVLDAFVPGGRITGQQVPYNLMPDFAREDLGEEIEFRQPIAEITEMLATAQSRSAAALWRS